MIPAKHLTVEEFDEFVHLPANADKLFEFIGGEIVEVPSNPYSSKIALRIGRLIGNFVDEHDLGHVTGEAGGYVVSGERYAPDVAFISYDRQSELATSGYNPAPPELAVEVISSDRSSELNQLRIKVSNYLAAGTIVWVIKPDDKQVEVYEPGQPVKILGENDTLTGNDILSEFVLPVKDIFPKKPSS